MKRIIWSLYMIIALVIAVGPVGCGNEENASYPATFTANEEPTDYTTTVGFLKFLNNYEIDYFRDQQDSGDGKNSLLIQLPEDVRADAVYDQHSRGAEIAYWDAEGTFYYSRFVGSSMEIKVAAWQGRNGYGQGTFSATLSNEEGDKTVKFVDGWFEGLIHN